MDFTEILQKLRQLAIEDETLYSLIETRFFPHAIQVELEDQVYPAVGTRLLKSYSMPGKELYPIKSYLFDCVYVSEKSIDEANDVYKRFYAIINNNRYTLDSGVMVVKEDSGLIDISGIYGKRYLYALSNTLEVRKIDS
jgi:hypothetical protein